MKKQKSQFSQVKYKDLDINILAEPGHVGYAFHFEGNNYGSKTKLKTSKRQEVLDACFALCIQAVLSYEELKNKHD